MYAEYQQLTGRFRVYDRDRQVYEATGYAGRGDGRNNPGLEHVPNVGPLPAAVYRIGAAAKHPRLGPRAFPLTPIRSALFGRSGFFIHGDNSRGDASRGCIVLAAEHRREIERLRPSLLIVEAGEP